MSGLVGYGSSDDEDEIQERPAKVAKTTADITTQRGEQVDATPHLPLSPTTRTPTVLTGLDPTSPTQEQRPPQGPTAAPPAPSSTPTPNTTTPSSPRTTARTQMHNLTLPTHPNFTIPRSPSPPTSPSTQAALAASTKKLTRFLDLKRKGVHFNARLNDSSSLRNPSLLPKLMEFVGVSEEESRMTTLGDGEGSVPVRWREDVFVEGLVRENERWRRRRLKEREKVEFVGEKSNEESGESTPVAVGMDGLVGRKDGSRTRFGQR